MPYYNVRDAKGRFVKESKKKCNCGRKCKKKAEKETKPFDSSDISDATLSCLSTGIMKLADDIGLFDIVNDTSDLTITVSMKDKVLWKDDLLIQFI